MISSSIYLHLQEFYDQTHNLFRIDLQYDGQQGGSPGPLTFIHDISSSVQYVIGNQIRFCLPQSLQEATYFWDLATNDDGTVELVSPNGLFFRGSQYNYTYQGATNIRGVDVDSWVSYREFESFSTLVNLSNAYYQVFYTRPGWSFYNVQSATTDPVPWRIVINGTVSTRQNMTDDTIITYNSTFRMDLFEFSTDEPPYDAFDVSSCSAPDDYYVMVLLIPGNENYIDFGRLRRNIRTGVSDYTGLRPLQIGNIQVNNRCLL